MDRYPRTLLALAVVVALVAAACGDDGDETGAEARVSFASPTDGGEVTSPVQVEMVAEGLTIEPAGRARDGAGHFHVMVDRGCVEPGETIPSDVEGYIHYGKAQTEADLELGPGEHTLCLQAGDGQHTALDLTDEITVEVS
ncbi:MAG: DUF4399 domain-containing protein [Acidimicrobiales bacterium]